MEIYTLQELYPTQEAFVTSISNAVSTYYSPTFTVNAGILSFQLKSIYQWYIHNYTAFGGTLQVASDNFKQRLVQDICDVYLYIEKKILHFISVNQDTLGKTGGMTSNTTITPNLENNVFTKQASTPSVIQPTSEFIDNYSDYQSKTTSTHTGTDTHNTTISRSGSQEDMLKVIALLPKSLSEDIIDAVKYDFIIVIGDC